MPEMSSMFEPNVDFPSRFFKKTIPHFKEIRPVGVVFIHAEGHIDGQTQGSDENKRHFSGQYERA